MGRVVARVDAAASVPLSRVSLKSQSRGALLHALHARLPHVESVASEHLVGIGNRWMSSCLLRLKDQLFLWQCTNCLSRLEQTPPECTPDPSPLPAGGGGYSTQWPTGSM